MRVIQRGAARIGHARRTPLWLGGIALSLAAFLGACQGVPTPRTPDANSLEGHWAGEGREGNGPRWKCTMTITGNSLHFFRDSNYWFRANLALPAGTEPQQLHATIKDTSHKDHIGEVVLAICRIEDGILTIAASDHAELPQNFDEGQSSLFVLRKVPSGSPQARKAN
jgi:hypothetical protein